LLLVAVRHSVMEEARFRVGPIERGANLTE
jgi:hypothetical protein